MLADSGDGDGHAGEEQPGPDREGGTTAALWRHLRSRLTRKLSARQARLPAWLFVSSFSGDALQIEALGDASADSPPGPASAIESAAGKGESAQAAYSLSLSLHHKEALLGKPRPDLGVDRGNRYNC